MLSRTMCVFGVAVVMSATVAGASQVEVDIHGLFGSVTGTPFPGLAVGDTFDAALVYDTTTPASAGPSGPHSASYIDAVKSASVVFHTSSGDVSVNADQLTGSYSIPGAPPFIMFQSGAAFVLAQPVTDISSGDHLNFAAKSSVGPGGPGLFLYFDLFSGLGHHPLNEVTALPSSIGSEFAGGTFQAYPDGSNSSTATILSVSTHAVPAPAALGLVPLGCALVARRRRRA